MALTGTDRDNGIKMLGHADLRATQIYTHVSIDTVTHPAKLDTVKTEKS